ncbi:MAG: pyridoxal-phosphate dependent enzyme, partial [Albidovulum sp.]
GGLAAGVTSVFSEVAPETGFRFAEPLGGASLAAAITAGEPVTLKRVNSFVDGAAVARVGDRPFARLRGFDAAQIIAAPEDRICITMLEMLNVEGIVLEPAGALSLDVLPDLAGAIRGRRVVCVTSGGNFDFERLPEVKERAQRYAGLKKYFILRMPQRPGALREFLAMLGPDDDIARFEYLKKSARNFGSVLIGIETKSPGSFADLTRKMDEAAFSYRDITDDEALAEFLV